MIWETVRLALRSVRRNALRSFLTLLGIVIGVAAVIAMLTIGAGTTEKVKADIAKLGSNLLVVRPGRPPAPGTPFSFAAVRPLGEKETAALKQHLEGARAVSPAAQKQVRIVYGTESLTSSVTGTDTAFFAARDWDVASGRLFSESEVRGGTSVCVIGQTVRGLFFGDGDPDGQSIRVGKTSCRVIGVLESKGTSGFGQDQDNVVLMPLLSFQRRIAGDRDIDTIYVSAAEGVATSDVQEEIETILRETRRIAPYQNATGLQVTSAVLAGMVWALENPNSGIVEADEMDYRRCLEVQMPYLGPVIGAYTDWTPLDNRPGFFPEDVDETDPWQFRNILVR